MGFGNPAAVVAVGVVAYRLVSFWRPIPSGLAAYLLVERHLVADGRQRGLGHIFGGLTPDRGRHP